MSRFKTFLIALGPGILFAATAVGVSHLVQATRAGADYGFGLMIVVLLALILKYPFFEFGPRYTAATGRSLVDGYKTMGTPVLIAFMVFTFITMFTTQASVTIVTAALAANLFGIGLSVETWSALIMAAVSLLLILGRYRWLDRMVKGLMLLLFLATLTAAILAAGESRMPAPGDFMLDTWDVATIAFIIALFGWMPAPIEASAWHSTWSVAREGLTHSRTSLRNALLDFQLGYGVTAIIALLFLALGAWVMFGTDEGSPNDSVAFTEKLVTIYTTVLGQWTYFIVVAAALAAMFSTTLALADAYPRLLRRAVEIYFPDLRRMHRVLYWICLLVVVGGALLLITNFVNDLPGLIDIATTMAFVTAPFFAYINFRAVTHPSIPEEFRPPRWLVLFAWIGLICMTVFSVFYVVWRFL